MKTFNIYTLNNLAKTKFLVLGFFATLGFLVSCNTENSIENSLNYEETESQEDIDDPTLNAQSDVNTEFISLSVGEKNTNDALNDFSFDLINKVAENYNLIYNADDNENMSVSPISAIINLAMLANSVDKVTRKSILSALNTGSLARLNSTCKKLIDFLPRKENGVEMICANSVWFDDIYTLSDEYISDITNYFYADIRPTKFETQQSVNDINAWCAVKTNNLIDKIVEQPNSSLVALCINAMYFYNSWALEFDVSKTENKNFYGTNGVQIVPTMHRKIIVSNGFYADGWFRFSIPFKGLESEMVILFPNEGINILDIAKIISINDLLVENYEDDNILLDLYLPKFSIKQNFSMKPILSALGIDTSNANYNMIGINNFGPIDVYQSNVVSINEEGAELASVTFDYMTGGAAEYRNLTLEVNRPFMYFVLNRVTNTIIMAGIVSNI